MIKRIFVLLFMMVVLAAQSYETNAQDWNTKKTNQDNGVTHTVRVTFSDDSLKTVFLPSVYVLPYQDYIAKVTFRSTGTVRNWSVTTYLGEWLKTPHDTTYWNISQVWDTTGQYTNKPVSDTVTIKLSGLPSSYLFAKIKGLAGNREDCVLDIAVTLFREED